MIEGVKEGLIREIGERRYNEVGAPDNRITGINAKSDAPDKDLKPGI